jgi:rRNA maturation endonuclease Nob1
MRPNESEYPAELYECHSCGSRAKAPDGRVCDECGGTLQNLSRGRDL